jgi:hypothetical protein
VLTPGNLLWITHEQVRAPPPARQTAIAQPEHRLGVRRAGTDRQAAGRLALRGMMGASRPVPEDGFSGVRCSSW